MKSTENPKLNSLQASWKSEAQAAWVLLRAQAIDGAVNMLAAHANFDDVYNYLADQRLKIAKQLSPEEVDFIKGVAIDRSNPESEWYDSIANTELWDIGKYASFFNVLSKLFFLANVPTEDELKKNPGYTAIIKKINKNYKPPYARITIYNGIVYSSVLQGKRIDNQDVPRPTLTILHAPATNIAEIIDRAKDVFDRLNQSETLSDLKKIKAIKEIIWHLTHAMPRGRGNAAICEMLLEALLKYHKIEYDFSQNKVPPDLLAIFSETPAQFDKLFIINPQIENKAEQILNENDAIWRRFIECLPSYQVDDMPFLISPSYEVSKTIRDFVCMPNKLLEMLSVYLKKPNELIEILDFPSFQEGGEIYQKIKSQAFDESHGFNGIAYCCYVLITNNIQELDLGKLDKVIAMLTHQDSRAYRDILLSLERTRDILNTRMNTNDLSLQAPIYLNLAGAKLNKMNLENLNLSNARISNKTDFSETNLKNTNIQNMLRHRLYNKSNMIGADLSGSELEAIDFRHKNLERAKLIKSNLKKINCSEGNMRAADLSGADLTDADLYGVNLQGAKLHDAILINTELSGANLIGVDFKNAKFISDINDINQFKADLDRFNKMSFYNSDSRLLLRNAVLNDIISRVDNITLLEEAKTHDYFIHHQSDLFEKANQLISTLFRSQRALINTTSVDLLNDKISRLHTMKKPMV